MESRKYVYNESNQLVSVKLFDGKKTTSVSYTYDADGNLTAETGRDGTDKVELTYTYTVENRLEAVYDGKELLMAAAYDGDGNRVFQLNYNLHTDEDWKENSGNGNGNNKDNAGNGNSGNKGNATNAETSGSQNQSGILFPISSETSDTEEYLISLINTSGKEKNYELIEYINDVNREYTEVLVEQNINGTLDTAYVYGAAIGIGSDRLSLDRFDSSTGYYLYDPKGSVTGITNEEGQIYQSYRYSVFGEITFGAPQYENEYTYNGESYNPNIKSQYLRARYYCVVTADFLTEDSYLGNIREPLTLNRYNYCVGNPVNYADPSGNDFQSATEFLFEAQRFALEFSVLNTISMMSMTSYLYEAERNKPTPQEMWQDAKDGLSAWADGIKTDLYGFYIGALNDFAAKGETQRKIAVGTYIAHKIVWQNLEAFVDGFEQGMGDYHPTYLEYNSARADLQYSVHAGCYSANLVKTVSGVVQVVDGVLLMVDGLLNTAVSPGTGPAAGLVGAAALEEVVLGYGVTAGGVLTLTESIPAALEEVGAMYSIGISAGRLASETQIKAGDKTPKGREYTKHGAEQANERGFDSQKIDSIIDNNCKHRTKEIDKLTGEVTWRYQDKRGNTVITNEWGDKIVTVYSHPISANGGNYIPSK